MALIYMAISHDRRSAFVRDFAERTNGRFFYEFYLDRPPASVTSDVGAKVVPVNIPEAAGQVLRLHVSDPLVPFGFAGVHISKQPNKLLFHSFYPFDAFDKNAAAAAQVRGKGIATILHEAIVTHLSTVNPAAVVHFTRNAKPEMVKFWARFNIAPGDRHTIGALLERTAAHAHRVAKRFGSSGARQE